MEKIAVIGAGAAGCFFAVEAKRRHPESEICIYESGTKPLAKVALTGGGRCNLTNSFKNIQRLSEAYPRGEQIMRRALGGFSNEDTIRWFAKEGVRTVTQEDQCVFPASQDAMQIVRTLEHLIGSQGIGVFCNKRVKKVVPPPPGGSGYCMEFDDGSTALANKIVITMGGCNEKVLKTLLPADIEIVGTVPSLFTFKIDDKGLNELMGTVVDDVAVGLAGTNYRSEGILLITDWGLSGPAALRLSSYGARYLAGKNYRCPVVINWLNSDEAGVRGWIESALRRETTVGKASAGASAGARSVKMVSSVRPDGITERLWKHILGRAGLREDIRWNEIGQKGINRLAGSIVSDTYEICGRAAFKEEFVTCGGVAGSAVNINTLESRLYPGLFFAGEVLDIDAITGGFNLQAAWSTAMEVAEHI